MYAPHERPPPSAEPLVNVPSYEFLAFAAVVAILASLSARPGWRRAIMLTANVGFLLTFSHTAAQLAPLVGFLALGYGSAKFFERYKNRALFAVLVVVIVLAFCWLKHYTFIPDSAFLSFPYVTIGLSYVFFRVLHLVIDAYQDALPEPISLAGYVSYTLNFTCLVSGPIQLFADYRRTESVQPASLSLTDVGAALDRIVVGYFKVAVLSPVLWTAHAYSVSGLSDASDLIGRVLCGVFVLTVYPVYLYINFSGYTDFVIGTARFLRLELPENFNHPFVSEGFIEFWGRWHMTLSNWWKTYVYGPLFMALIRRFPSPHVQPLLGVVVYFVTFFFVGVWHGQTSMFLFLGVLLGLGVSVNKLYQIEMTQRLGRARYRSLCRDRWYSTLSRGVTFSYFAFASLWFWSTWSQLGSFIIRLGPLGLAGTVAVTVACSALALAAFKVTLDWYANKPAPLAPAPSLYMRTAWYAAIVVLVLSVTVVLSAPAPTIVYKAF